MSLRKKLINNKFRLKKKHKKTSRLLGSAPQRLGNVILVYTGSPKKPNSAKRKLAKINLNYSKKEVICHIPGEKAILQKFNTVLIRGASLRDLPGVKYRIIQGKYDFASTQLRKTSRSKYGTKK